MDTTIKAADVWPPELDTGAGTDRGLWKSTMAAASQALEAAKGMQAAVGQTLSSAPDQIIRQSELYCDGELWLRLGSASSADAEQLEQS